METFKIYFLHILQICNTIYWLSQSGWESFKSYISVPPVLRSPGYTPLVFKAQHFWGSSLWGRSHGMTFLMWSINPLLLGEKLHICEILPNRGGHCTGYGVFGETLFLPFLPVWIWSFSSLFWWHCSASFQIFSEGIISHVAVDLLCLWEGMSLGSSMLPSSSWNFMTTLISSSFF